MQRLLVDPLAANLGVSHLPMKFRTRVMQSFGGSIRIASASGAGTTVTLEFPSFKDRMHRSYQ
jgi:two-component system response regulator PhcR